MAADEAQAATIAHALVAEGLASCVNLIGGVRSIYRWRGTVEDQREWLLLKTQTHLYAKVERRVKDLHSYEVPEVIAMRIVGGARDYLAWLHTETAPVRRRGAGRRSIG
jgi:periplasmic divalent cation tolerance protein